MIKVIAATVSVAHITLLIIITSDKVRALNKYLFIKNMKPDKNIKPMIVPITPKNQIMPKFSKNNDLRRLYPAEKMMGGSMIAKNI